jgi:hypothetical protein
VELTVADTGQGISGDFLPHIFERFRQAEGGTRRKHGGLGLGLSIVKHLVEAHGGTLSAASEGLGKGTTFVVRLPLSVARRLEAAVPPKLQAASFPAGLECPRELEGLSILVLDDEGDTRDFLTTLLEGCKARVTPAASVEEGLRALKAVRPRLIISDIGMPGEDEVLLDGSFTCQNIKKKTNGSCIVLQCKRQP